MFSQKQNCWAFFILAANIFIFWGCRSDDKKHITAPIQHLQNIEIDSFSHSATKSALSIRWIDKNHDAIEVKVTNTDNKTICIPSDIRLGYPDDNIARNIYLIIEKMPSDNKPTYSSNADYDYIREQPCIELLPLKSFIDTISWKSIYALNEPQGVYTFKAVFLPDKKNKDYASTSNEIIYDATH